MTNPAESTLAGTDPDTMASGRVPGRCLGTQVPIEGLLYENLSVVHLLPWIPGAVAHTIWQLPCRLSVKIIQTN